MKVRLTTLYASPVAVYQPGSIHDLADAEAVRLIAGGFAVSMEAKKVKPVEFATLPIRETETADAQAGKRRNRKPISVEA